MYFSFITSVILALTCVITCQNTIKLIKNKVTISWKHYGNETSFLVSTSLTNDKSLTDAWLAIGFNDKSSMANASVVLCRYSLTKAGSVQHYLNTNAYNSFPLDRDNLVIGIEKAFVKNENNKFICSFERGNNIVKQGYLRIITNESLYLLSAFGTGKKIIV